MQILRWLAQATTEGLHGLPAMEPRVAHPAGPYRSHARTRRRTRHGGLPVSTATYPRPRGFTDYQPRAKAAELVKAVKAVIGEYQDQLPLTLRQIFYVLVTRDQLDKTEKAYKYRLIETMNRARRGHLIPMDAIRDDGFRMADAPGWQSKELFTATWHLEAEHFTLDRQTGQERRILLWCEAGGMVPQLERIAHPYSVQVASSGGFDSLTSKHAIGKQLAAEPTLVLHIGDHDPSGVHMFGSLGEDVKAFADYYGGNVEFIRLAVTPAQVDQYDLPTAPPKTTDRRAFTGLTTQAEALDPRTLSQLVQEAITGRMDADVYLDVLRREAVQRADLVEVMQ